MITKLRVEKSTWSSYYENIGDPSSLDFLSSVMYHQRYLREIIRSKPQSILEVGTGRGVHAIFLSYFIPQVIGIDNEEKLIKKAAMLNRKLKGRAQFLLMDAFRLSFKDQSFAVCCSQGLLEHFADSDIRTLIDNQLRLSKSVIFSVPSSNYPVKNVGDERLVDLDGWRRVLKNNLDKIFYYGPSIDSSKRFLGQLKLGTLRKAMSVPRRAQVCIVIKS